jgi:hypothetical protein
MALLDDLFDSQRIFFEQATRALEGPTSEGLGALRTAANALAQTMEGGSAALAGLLGMLDEAQRTGADRTRVEALERELVRLREELRVTRERAAQPPRPPDVRPAPPPTAAPVAPPTEAKTPADRFELIELD